MEDEKLADKLLDRILMVLMPYDQIDVERIKAKLTVVLDDYQICPKQEALVVYTEGKNDYYLRKFLLAKAVAGRQERTLRQYKDEVGRALRGIGKDADTITADDIQVYLAKVLSRGGSKCYCDNIRRDLSSFYNWLYREEIIRTNPMNKIDNIKFKREKEKALTDMEIEMMRQACQTTMQKAIMEMLLSTGCRAAELVSIKIADMDEDKVSILGKGGKWRTVYINAKAFVAIKNYLADRKDTNPYLFPREINTKDRTMISNFSRKDWFKDPRLVTKADHFGRDSVNNMVRTIGKRAGVKGVHAAKTAQYIEIGQISAGDAEHVTTLCKRLPSSTRPLHSWEVEAMTEWGVVGVIVVLLGLLATVTAPMIRLNTTLTKLNDKFDTLDERLTGVSESNHASHRRLWEHEEMQDNQLHDHETRIQILEHGPGCPAHHSTKEEYT